MNIKKYLNQVVKLNNTYFPNAKTTKKELLDILDAHGRVFVKLKKDKVVGYLILRRKDEAYNVDFIGITRDCRRRGLASELVRKAVTYAMRSGDGANFIFTYASIYNTISINMLIKNGFTVESINTRWINMKYG